MHGRVPPVSTNGDPPGSVPTGHNVPEVPVAPMMPAIPIHHMVPTHPRYPAPSTTSNARSNSQEDGGQMQPRPSVPNKKHRRRTSRAKKQKEYEHGSECSYHPAAAPHFVYRTIPIRHTSGYAAIPCGHPARAHNREASATLRANGYPLGNSPNEMPRHPSGLGQWVCRQDQ